jgi:hypothetical protein
MSKDPLPAPAPDGAAGGIGTLNEEQLHEVSGGVAVQPIKAPVRWPPWGPDHCQACCSWGDWDILDTAKLPRDVLVPL